MSAIVSNSLKIPSRFLQTGIFGLTSYSIRLQIPYYGLQDLWNSILLAVPKKKTSYSKKRSRFLAGKALKDKTNLNRCPVCHSFKLTHHMCPSCYKGLRQEWKSQDL
ncbi:ribosomal protein subunit L32 [Schizosaccharomyces octosporus yFS286]|uniref:Large ribosomal subunit protein bL32m n=1 Tax=Schizosaccharomyces octosporus (strain yFS286) TaxID=483514 RepID=S9PUL3_SCHOY|nr:ribosomal protein subunit L32 [Schizosaccharomyces octosporus yFS286]EPX71193.1 ribosomal protein subunit L32 [Schizosaccharomyces octosporus yFS286]